MNEGKRFDVLDSWRGIAACLVALYHIRPSAHGHLIDVTLIRNSYLFGAAQCHAGQSGPYEFRKQSFCMRGLPRDPSCIATGTPVVVEEDT